jgi:hypothetical protein
MRAVARTLALTLLVTVACSRALVFASPPDPTWVAGVYDGADGDEVVIRTIDRVGSIGVNTTVAPPVPLPDVLGVPPAIDYERRHAVAIARGPPRGSLRAACRAPPSLPLAPLTVAPPRMPPPFARGGRRPHNSPLFPRRVL